VSVEVFGIRHHGPGSARSLVAALDRYGPDQVLIEGPADADAVIGWAASEQTEPPVALLAYAPNRPGLAAFWPFAVFSPEWQALTWALQRDRPVGFCDLPAAHALLARFAPPDEHGEPDPLIGGDPDSTSEGPDRLALARSDPLAALAAAAGYDDAERWWDDVIESRRDGSSPFPALVEAMAELRAALPSPDPAEAGLEERREAYMRQKVRAALRAGRQRVAVVCGAWHAPALVEPLPSAAADSRLLRGMPKQKIIATWIPWTHARLASASGYGAGITSAGWYHHLWTSPDQPIARWFARVAGTLRARDLVVSSAHVIEAVRLAGNLAALRGRPLAGLAEVTDATRAVLCEGDELAVRMITDELVVGQALGSVDEGVPTVPLEADLIARCRTLRIRREATPRVHDLDLRKPYDRQRSVLFHRLRVLGLDWIRPAESGIASRGTFRETWQSAWRPELSLALIEAAGYGTTVETAATAKLLETVRDGTLADLTDAIERCIRADLPTALSRLLAELSTRAALDVDAVHLMDAVPPLARAQRYGDVRGTDISALAAVSRTLLVRTCAALPAAVTGLDEDSARLMRRRVDALQSSISLIEPDEPIPGPDRPALRGLWLDTLAGLVDRADVHGALLGRIVRVLADADVLDDAPARVHRALSYGAPAADKAAWVDGFFCDGALLLIHDEELLELLDRWVAQLGEQEFVDVLPLVRRTFSTFSVPERRAIGERVERLRQPARQQRRADDDLDLELAGPALTGVAAILGGGHSGERG
jgi:Family of unknown function (DUF5682)